MAAIRPLVAVAAGSIVLLGCGSEGPSANDTTPPSDSVPSATEAAPTTVATTTTVAPTTSVPPTTALTTTTSTTSTTSTTTTTTTTTTTVPAPESARYRVTLVMEWSPETHPATLPPGWHSSPAVLATHAAPGDVVPVGGIASPGVESMAETGMTALLTGELTADAAVGEFVTGRRIDETGTDELEVTATQSTPYLSLVTMLAPSPDWFVGVVDVPVFEAGAWIERIELDLAPYDAGTDSGPGFTSDDADTQPRGRIVPPLDAEYVTAAAEGRFGRVVIERIG